MERGKGEILMRNKRKTPVERKPGEGVSKGMDNINPFRKREPSREIKADLEKGLWSREPEIRKRAAVALVRKAVDEGKWYRIRELLDEFGPDVKKDVDDELDRIIKERRDSPL